MIDFDRDERPTLDDLKNNWKVKLVLGLLAAVIIATIVMDVLGYIGKWG